METEELANRLRQGDRRALARAITLVESARPDHRAAALALGRALAVPQGTEHGETPGGPQPATRPEALRIGLSGTPGVGKSSFIDAFGMRLVEAGLRVAVLAVDPSSTRSGGSILGDKTRMPRLARAPGAFIRPSPSQAEAGGVARRSREVAALCEAAGFDVVLVETVGVGQSEVAVAEMTDLFVLLMAPAGGDELQGVKRGIMEIADLILVNKTDGDLAAQAMRTRADYAGALRLLRRRPQDPEGFPKALCVSALQETGLAEAWSEMQVLAAARRASGAFAARRADQARAWFDAEVRRGLLSVLTAPGAPREALARLGAAVRRGEIPPEVAAAEMLALLGR